MDTAHPTALLFADVKRAAACLLPAVAVLGLYAYLNWNVIGQPPYYDEMWKLDLVVPHGTVERYFTHDTPIPIGWLYLNKALLSFTPDNFAVIRSFGPLWVALAMALLVWRLSPASHIHWPVVAGATFLATCLPVHAIIRNFNQYSFELLYGVTMVCVALRPIRDARWRRAALLVVAMAPVFTMSSTFFVPGVAVAMYWNSSSGRERIEAAAALIVSFTIAWPLVFSSECRVNLGWIWAIYVCFGCGAATVITRFVKPEAAPVVVLAALVGGIQLGTTWARYEPDNVPFRALYKDIAGIVAHEGRNQVIVQFHFMARFYPDFLISLKRPDAFTLVGEMRMDPGFVAQLAGRLSGYPGASTIWVVVPFECGWEEWADVEKLVLPGYIRAPGRHGLGSMIEKFEKTSEDKVLSPRP